MPDLSELERASYSPTGRLEVRAASDRFAAAAMVESAARKLALPVRIAEAAKIAVCELAQNLVRHAGGGRIEVAVSAESGVLRVAASDEGPPIENVELALADGSTAQGPILPEQVYGRSGIGAGLGAIRRGATALVVAQGPKGKVITAYFTRDEREEGQACPVTVRTLP